MTPQKETQEDLKDCEKKFFKALQYPLPVTLTSAIDHRYIEVNTMFERISGWKRNEVIGRTPFDINIWVNPDDRIEIIRQLLSEVLLLHPAPANIGIKLGHLGHRFGRDYTQVLLKQHSILVDDESHHSRIAVLGRVSYEGESTHHFSIDHVVLRPSGGMLALPFQHLKIIAVKRGVGIRFRAISFCGCECY